MSRKHISLVFGTRPEAIKMAPVYLAMKNDSRIDVSLVATAQHREMLDQVLDIFDIKPDFDLDIMSPNQTLAEISSRVITGVQKVLSELKPDAVLVHGDTTTCLCSAIAAFYERIPVGHVEAGLRTYNFQAPWPEEMNRRLVDPICRWCLASTNRAAENLRNEKIPEENIFITGNTVVDALMRAVNIVNQETPSIKSVSEEMLNGKRLILVTGHRRESFGKPFEELCLALRQLVEDHSDTVLVYPVHLNPNVQKPVKEILGSQDRIHLIEPVDYLPFVHLMARSHIIITDSGGIQEEAPSLNKPVLIMRSTTERPEAIEAGLAKLVGTNKEDIVREASVLLSDQTSYAKMAKGTNPYGDGKASERIIDIMLSTFDC